MCTICSILKFHRMFSRQCLPLLVSFISFCLVAGCQSLTKSYDGPQRAINEVCTLKANGSAYIRSIDGKKIDKYGPFELPKWELLPGPHTVIYEYGVEDGIKASNVITTYPVTLQFTAEAGHHYWLNVVPSARKKRYRAVIIDWQTKQIVADSGD
jgi:hypothetical protein